MYIKNSNFLIFYIKNGNFLKTKSDSNRHQNAPNCTIKKIIGGGMPPDPLNEAHGEATCKFPNLKKK